MIRTATLSNCGRYRYDLGRRWGSGGDLCFVMLNPSTADAVKDDPTIRRCIGFATRGDFGGIVVVNLYAWRTPDPDELHRVVDPVGPQNVEAVRTAIRNCDLVVAAWGASLLPKRPTPIFEVLDTCAKPVTCLGYTKSGAPRHPLYVHGDTKLEPWPRRSE